MCAHECSGHVKWEAVPCCMKQKKSSSTMPLASFYWHYLTRLTMWLNLITSVKPYFADVSCQSHQYYPSQSTPSLFTILSRKSSSEVPIYFQHRQTWEAIRCVRWLKWWSTCAPCAPAAGSPYRSVCHRSHSRALMAPACEWDRKRASVLKLQQTLETRRGKDSQMSGVGGQGIKSYKLKRQRQEEAIS